MVETGYPADPPFGWPLVVYLRIFTRERAAVRFLGKSIFGSASPPKEMVGR
jgi:hypothetical protein